MQKTGQVLRFADDESAGPGDVTEFVDISARINAEPNEAELTAAIAR